jgi:hypothetical protein
MSLNKNILLFLGCSYLLHSAINPFLYSICSKRFRRGFLDLINKRSTPGSNQHANDLQAGKEMSFDQIIRGRNRKKVVNKKALLRHFDNPFLSPDDNNLERDKVILVRNKSKQITILKKCKSSFHCNQTGSGISDDLHQQHSEPLYQGILGGISRKTCFLSNRNHYRTNFRHCSSSHVEVPNNSMKSFLTEIELKPKGISNGLRTQHSDPCSQLSRTEFRLSDRNGRSRSKHFKPI